MGIPMIHADLKPLSHSSSPSTNRTLDTLLAHRSEIEAQMDIHEATLKRNNNIDMPTPLVTVDGFPRSDIDVAAVRVARAAIVRLRNDYKRVDREIEGAVHEAFRTGEPMRIDFPATRAQADGDSQGGSNSEGQRSRPGQQRAFCFVNTVSPGSPAEAAGLFKDDKIVSFGSAEYHNHEKMQRMASEVQRALVSNQELALVVTRMVNGSLQVLTLQLTPNSAWGGRGAVGAHFLPL